MKVSILTTTFNNCNTIEESIRSVLSQCYKNIEYIIVDGSSTDGTREIIKKYENYIAKWISEQDEGVYHALNKGLKMSAGDIIGFLHADDLYAHEKVIENVVSQMTEHMVASCYGDLEYVSKENTDRVIRYWKSGRYSNGVFQNGWMPPHPTFFVKKETYERYGYFDTSFKIAADYELMLRFLEKNKISTLYIPKVLVKMRVGGMSNRSLKNMLVKSSEDHRAWTVNGLRRPFYTIFLKNVRKVSQFFLRN